MSRKPQGPEDDLWGVIPAFGPIETWCWVSGMSRDRTYDLIGLGHLKAKRVGGRAFIDIRRGMAYIQSLPDVIIHPRQRQPTQVEAA
jgi:hypothetical protein